MSHIPAAAMPHAQAHEHAPSPPPPPPAKPAATTPWLTLAIGGTLALGGALTAAWLLRGERKPAPHKGGKRRKGGRGAGKRKASHAAPPADA